MTLALVVLSLFLVSVTFVMNDKMMRRFVVKRPEIVKRKIGLVGLVANYTLENLHKKWSYEDHYLGYEEESKNEVFAQLSQNLNPKGRKNEKGKLRY